ncbi:unnamed protein product [Danaus chrysippus]|uniref:(African queen) hypothetical protein n=1 Tax=Danaus chrysippus TaxID=151541 RepID=A0A8J2QQY2_9NEOP|nr:unnamed protein product [Danaus chrysippus]
MHRKPAIGFGGNCVPPHPPQRAAEPSWSRPGRLTPQPPSVSPAWFETNGETPTSSLQDDEEAKSPPVRPPRT